MVQRWFSLLSRERLRLELKSFTSGQKCKFYFASGCLAGGIFAAFAGGILTAFAFKSSLKDSWESKKKFDLIPISRSTIPSKPLLAASVKRNEAATTTSSPDLNHLNFIANAVEGVIDSVVNISVETETSKLFQKTTLVSSGSGFFIAPGVILTNAHVVIDAVETSKMIITTSDGQELAGYVYSLDTLSDLAVIRLTDKSMDSIRNSKTRVSKSEDKDDDSFPWPIVDFGSKENAPRLGDWVIAIGSPFGLQNTVTVGVVSSQSRKSIEIGGPSDDSRVRYIQTDCVVHTGSSGGPLVNLKGQVIGINTTRAESEGISFAIRADLVTEMVQQLVKEGKILRPFLGIHMTTLTKALWTQLESSGDIHKVPSVPKGVLVTNVLPSSPAQKGGLQVLDVITHVNGSPIDNSLNMLSKVGLQIGNTVKLDIKRCVPLEVDWDGSVKRYEVINQVINVVPAELDIFTYRRIQTRRETGV